MKPPTTPATSLMRPRAGRRRSRGAVALAATIGAALALLAGAGGAGAYSWHIEDQNVPAATPDDEPARAMAADRERGFLYVLSALGTITKLSTVGGTEGLSFGHWDANASDIVVDQVGHDVYALDFSRKRIARFDAGGNRLASWPARGQPVDVAIVNHRGLPARAYVLSEAGLPSGRFAKTVDVYNAHSGVHISSFAVGTTCCKHSGEIAADPESDDIYVKLVGGIQRYAWTGARLDSWGDGRALSYSLSVGPRGDVFESAFSFGVRVWGRTGTDLPDVGPITQGGDPRFTLSAEIDGDRDLFIGLFGGSFGPAAVIRLEPDPIVLFPGVAVGPRRFQRAAPGTLDTAARLLTPPRTNSATATFGLASFGGTRFGCQLKRKGNSTKGEQRRAHWHPCDEVKTYGHLRPGRYVFTGRSFSAAGKQDATPAKVSFVIDRRAPRTRIAGGPRGATHRRTARVHLRSSEKRSLFECRLQRSGHRRKAERRLARWHYCADRTKLTHLRAGRYRLRARAIDRAGNRDRSPATRAFRVRR